MSQTWKDRLISWAVWLACASPLLLFVWQGVTDDLTANPIQFILRQLGVWALRFLCVSLAVTPAARLLKQPAIARYRRRIGLWAFAYVCLHLVTYIAIDQQFDWGVIGKDIAKRPYITIGMAASVMLLSLAITSADKLRRKLGPKRWKRLHQLVYLIDPLPQIRKWAHKFFHVHGKDATVRREVIAEHGIFGKEKFVFMRTPGFGDSNWVDIISELRLAG